MDPSQILLPKTLEVHSKFCKKLDDHSEEAFCWMREILVEAKKRFAVADVELLPKTPSCKAKRRKKGGTTGSNKSRNSTRRNLNTDTDSVESLEYNSASDFEDPKPKKTTRASRTTKTRASSTRSTRSRLVTYIDEADGVELLEENETENKNNKTESKTKTKNAEIESKTKNIETETKSKKSEVEERLTDLNKENVQNNAKGNEVQNDSISRVQSANTVPKTPIRVVIPPRTPGCVHKIAVKSPILSRPVLKQVQRTPGSPSRSPKPVPSYSSLNVKEKVEAWKTLSQKRTPQKSPRNGLIPRPTGVLGRSPFIDNDKTPTNSVSPSFRSNATLTLSGGTKTKSQARIIKVVPSSPPKQPKTARSSRASDQKRVSGSRASLRVSMSKRASNQRRSKRKSSLATRRVSATKPVPFASLEPMEINTTESEDTEPDTEHEDTEEDGTQDDLDIVQEESDSSSKECSEPEATAQNVAEKDVATAKEASPAPPPANRRVTRSKIRHNTVSSISVTIEQDKDIQPRSASDSAAQRRCTRSKVRTATNSTESDNENAVKSVICDQPKRSTRSKIRQVLDAHAIAAAALSSEDDEVFSTPPAEVNVKKEPVVRSTRSKTRANNPRAAAIASVEEEMSQTRSTRTKTRSNKRPADDSDEPESIPQRKKSRASYTEDSASEVHMEEDHMPSPAKPFRTPDASSNRFRPVIARTFSTGNVNKSTSFIKKVPVQITTPGSSGNSTRTISFIKKTSAAPSTTPNMKERQMQAEKVMKMREKIQKDADRIRRVEQQRQQERIDKKRKMEERLLRVQERKLNKEKEILNSRKQTVQKVDDKTNKAKDAKARLVKEKAKLRDEKITVAMKKRTEEEEERKRKLIGMEEEHKRYLEMLQRKKAFEEVERLRKLEEDRKLAEEKRRLAEEERQKEILRKEKQLLEEEQERQRLKEEREKRLAYEKAERERLAKEKEKERLLQEEREQQEKIKKKQEEAAAAREAALAAAKNNDEDQSIKSKIEKHNRSIDTGAPSIQKINLYSSKTGLNKKPENNGHNNYDISDVTANDSDDEDNPRKVIPNWAKGSELKAALIHQYYHPPRLDEIFNPLVLMREVQLPIIFPKQTKFKKRTSSALWDSPMYKPNKSMNRSFREQQAVH